MAAYNYQWTSEWMDQPSAAGAIGQLQAQLAELERKVDAFENRSSQNTYYQQQPRTIPNYYHTEWQNQDYSWGNSYSEPSYIPNYFNPSPQPPVQKTNLEEILDKFLARTDTWTNDQESFAPPSLSYSPLQSQEPISNLEQLLIEATERMEKASEQMKLGTEQLEMRMSNQEIFAPSPSYQLEPSYQPQLYEVSYPQLQEEKFNLEEFLTRLENTERMVTSEEATIQNLENQMEQSVTNDYYLQYTLPSIEEINSTEEGEEQSGEYIISDDEEAYEVVGQDFDDHVEQEVSVLKDQPLNILPDDMPDDMEVNPRREGNELGQAITLQMGNELNEAVGGSLKRPHSEKEDSSVEEKRVKIYPCDETIFEDIKILNAREECYQVYVVKETVNDALNDGSYFLPLPEDEFGGGPQSSVDAEKVNEKTSRRHAMTIFAYEPD